MLKFNKKENDMAQLQEYKCPCCGGAIAFDSTIQKMKCPYCDTEFEMETLQGYDSVLKNEQPDDMRWEATAGSEWQEGEADGLRSYVCKSCGAYTSFFFGEINGIILLILFIFALMIESFSTP